MGVCREYYATSSWSVLLLWGILAMHAKKKGSDTLLISSFTFSESKRQFLTAGTLFVFGSASLG